MMTDLQAAVAMARARLEVANERPAQPFAELLEAAETRRAYVDEPQPIINAI